jgi:ubiquinone/menaquinone biosynthesis C-methylase UbiE
MAEPQVEGQRAYGIGRGKVFPAERAKSLLNPARRLVQSPSRTVARMDLAAGDIVLELGCGPGYFTPTLASVLGSGRVVACDLQSEMLRLVATRTGPDGVPCVQGDALRLPFIDAAFDAVVVILVLGEVPDRSRCIEELARVLRPGGRLVLCESRRDSDFIGLSELTSLVEPLGLQFEQRRGHRWEYTASFRRS